MNSQLSNYARKTLKEGLARCNDRQQLLFKRMYAGDLDMPIDQVVDIMPEDKLDWAMQQVESTLAKTA